MLVNCDGQIFLGYFVFEADGLIITNWNVEVEIISFDLNVKQRILKILPTSLFG